MKRSRAKQSAGGFSLFPFLAVLLCTVGVLIVMLVLMVQMARVDAAEDADHGHLLQPPDQQQMAKEDYRVAARTAGTAAESRSRTTWRASGSN